MLYRIVDMQNKVFYICDLESLYDCKKITGRLFRESKCIWIYEEETNEIVMKRISGKWEDLKFRW